MEKIADLEITLSQRAFLQGNRVPRRSAQSFSSMGVLYNLGVLCAFALIG